MHLEDFQPNMFNQLELEKKGFISNNDLNKRFSSLYYRYYLFLEQYINKFVNINKVDSLIGINQSNICPVSDNDKDIYQTLSSFKYFYIRNTLYIENFTEEELKLLETKDIYDDDIHNFVANSYKRIITTPMEREGTVINYGPMESSAFYAPCNSLIIGFRYDPLFEGELALKNDDAWYNNYQEQQIFIMTQIRDLEKEMQEKFDIPVKIIMYDEFSIKKKDNLSNMVILK